MTDFSEFYAMMQENTGKLKEIERLGLFRTVLMNCDTQDEVTHLCQTNVDLLNDNPGIYRAVKCARIRIARVRKEMKKSYENMMN
jgi:hypothetical protein